MNKEDWNKIMKVIKEKIDIATPEQLQEALEYLENIEKNKTLSDKILKISEKGSCSGWFRRNGKGSFLNPNSHPIVLLEDVQEDLMKLKSWLRTEEHHQNMVNIDDKFEEIFGEGF